MATLTEVDAQLQLERDAISCGRSRFIHMTAKLENQVYASATVYGHHAIGALMPKVALMIEDARSRYRQGVNGRHFKDVAKHLDDIEAEALANIALKVVFDQIFSPPCRRIKDGSYDTVRSITHAIGAAVMHEIQIRHYEKEAPGLLVSLKKNYWHAACGTRQKRSIAQVIMGRCGVNWASWSSELQTRLGGWLLDYILGSCTWFNLVKRNQGKKVTTHLEASEDLLLIKDEVIVRALAFSCLTWPMLIEPNDWSTSHRGGYLLNELVGLTPMVRGSHVPSISEGTPTDFVNRLQKVAYRVNSYVLGVAQELAAQGRGVGKFQPLQILPLPQKPVDIAENYDSRKAYRRAAAEVNNVNALAYKKSIRTRSILEVAQRFQDSDRFFLPWSFDYRGRAYPIPAFLHPHDTDFGKSLIRFSDESPVTGKAEEWLAFQVGTTYGLDKEPIQDRIQWARENHDLIKAVADDPIQWRSLWESADEPWQFLAACEEYAACCIHQTRQTTGLPVAIDATCSGLQVLAGLAKDATAASMVNVTPGERPRDAYAVVAEKAAPHVPETIRPHLNRKVVKRVVMTIPYNAKPHSNRTYIREALKEAGQEITKEELTQTVKAVRDAVAEVLPGPMAVMGWIEDTVRQLMADGATELVWTSPSGFVVHQQINRLSTKEINLRLMGRVRVSIIDGHTGPDIQRHKNSTSPNFIHSIDAAMLHLAFHDYRKPFTVIHDSIWSRATDMEEISHLIRQTYRNVFSGDVLQNWANEIGATTKPPIIGDLSVEDVLDSTYFFS